LWRLLLPDITVLGSAAAGPHLFGGDIDVGYFVVLADDGNVGQHIYGRDVSSKYADPVAIIWAKVSLAS
jgi:hypothetical protein